MRDSSFAGRLADFLGIPWKDDADFTKFKRQVKRAANWFVDHEYGSNAPPYSIWRRLDQHPDDHVEPGFKPLSVLQFRNMTFTLTMAEVAILRYLLVCYDPWEDKSYDIQSERDKVTSRLRFQILARDNFTCLLCGAKPKSGSNEIVLHVDHIIPLSKGGLTRIENLQTSCNKCNAGKSDIVFATIVEDNFLYQPPKDAYHPEVSNVDNIFIEVNKPLSKWQALIKAIAAIIFGT